MTQGHNGSSGLSKTLSNRLFIVALLFIGTYFVPFLVFIGVALAYVFNRRPEEEWETSHFQYVIRTLWFAILFAVVLLAIGLAVAAGLDFTGVGIQNNSISFIGFLLSGVAMAGALILCGVRIIMSLMNSIAHKPMPNPTAWLF